MTDSEQTSSPFLLRRLTALIYDSLLVLPLIMLSLVLFMGLRTLLGLGAAEDGTVQLDANLVRLIALLAAMLFYCGFWLKNGQTLGMQAWRIKLVSTRSHGLKPWQAMVRALGAVLSAACLGLGYLWCLVDRNGRYWHDYLSATELILLPKADKKAGSTAVPKEQD